MPYLQFAVSALAPDDLVGATNQVKSRAMLSRAKTRMDSSWEVEREGLREEERVATLQRSRLQRERQREGEQEFSSFHNERTRENCVFWILSVHQWNFLPYW